jgi:ketosteroid isomerase-like protein
MSMRLRTIGRRGYFQPVAQQDTRGLARDLLRGFLRDGNDLGSMDEALPVLTEFLSQVAAPDFVCVMEGGPAALDISYPGVEGLAKAWGEWGEAFATVTAELEDTRESEHHLVVLVNQVAVTRHDGVEISQPSALVFEFNDEGQVARAEFHLDQQAALRTAGLG